MKTARLRWAGHVIGMSGSEMSKRIMNYNPKGKRRAERSKEIWTDTVDNDTRKSDVTDWRIDAKDTDGWRRILEEAKAHL
jgi:hypothetical protein